MTRENKHVTRNDINSVSFSYIKFNFSFVSTAKDLCLDTLNEDDRVALLDRIQFLSSVQYKHLIAFGKEKGIESIPKKHMIRDCKVCSDFYTAPHREKLLQGDSDYYIFRLYPNDNPRLTRIIGTMYQTIFYVLFVDYNGTMYKH